MLFLIDYDRKSGRIITMRSFPNSRWHDAEESRLSLEIDHRNQGLEREIVTLEAPNEEALRKTHRRYFEEIADLIRMPSTTKAVG